MRRALVLWTDPGELPGPIRPIKEEQLKRGEQQDPRISGKTPPDVAEATGITRFRPGLLARQHAILRGRWSQTADGLPPILASGDASSSRHNKHFTSQWRVYRASCGS
jgi:hypothetical protein